MLTWNGGLAAVGVKLIAVAVAAGAPVLLFCRAGKDRTGLVSALVLHCCGITEAQILMDYTRSG
jgi:protein tyrosine/serine phosphatase